MFFLVSELPLAFVFLVNASAMILKQQSLGIQKLTSDSLPDLHICGALGTLSLSHITFLCKYTSIFPSVTSSPTCVPNPNFVSFFHATLILLRTAISYHPPKIFMSFLPTHFFSCSLSVLIPSSAFCILKVNTGSKGYTKPHQMRLQPHIPLKCAYMCTT